jgi:hypothetical protein
LLYLSSLYLVAHHCSVLCGVFCLFCLSSLYLVWPIIVVFCVVFFVCFV